MGITLSNQARTLDNTQLRDGKNRSLRDPIVIRVLPNGFDPSSLIVFSGQVICWEWESGDPDTEHNVRQVTLSETSGHPPIPVPRGLCSGQVCSTGSYQETVVTPGCYYFISDGHLSAVKVGTVKVVAAPPEVIKVSEQRFTPEYVEISEGDSVTWKWEAVKGNLNRIEFCSRHCGITSTKVDLDSSNTVAHTECFQNPGMYYFTGDQDGQMCVVKVTQRTREYSIRFAETGAEPALINAHVGDRIWVKNDIPKQTSGIMAIKAEDGGILVSSRRTGSKHDRHPNLLSYCFAFPGIYRVTCSQGFNTNVCSIVLVQPKPSDYEIYISQQGFETGLGSLKQGDRLWWVWSDEELEKQGFLIEEMERMTTGNKAKKETACKCVRESDYLSLIGCVGVMTTVADTPGLFTYRLKAIGDWTPSEAVCSMIVQTVSKEHIVRVNDHGFQPQIVNINPGDSVTWIWRDTFKSHNIQQVSHEREDIDDGFHCNFVSRPPDAFSQVFIDLGVFYFTSIALCGVYGAVVVTAVNQIHKVEVTLYGVDPDPLGVRAGDLVCWRWSRDQLYSINTIQSADEIEEIVKNEGIPQKRRCFGRTFNHSGLHHVVATAYLQDEDEPTLHPCDSFINTIYVDHAPYACRMKVSRDGFLPQSITLAKHNSILWYWDGNHDNKHNIMLVENPKGRVHPMTAHGPSFFESGSITSSSSFFHTFDTPGSYWVTSHGTDGMTCRIDVLNEAKNLLAPSIANSKDGGIVESGYQVFLSCNDNDVQILYTLDGHQPIQQHPLTKLYNSQEGIVLSKPGLYVIRAIATKDGWINSQTFTSKRFWVFYEDEDDMNEANQEREDELGLRQEITNWQWFSCIPFISYLFVYDNVIHINIVLPKIADKSLISGFQLYVNGVAYGGWLCASCPVVQVSGLTGDKIYHMVLVAFPMKEDFKPQLSNQLVVTCPLLSSLGGPVVSLETCNRVDAVVILWPANQSCLYTVLINGQPMGEQFFPEQDVDYCRILFEMENQEEEQTFVISIMMNHESVDQPLFSNEIQLALPLPQELVAANSAEPINDNQTTESAVPSGVSPTEIKELLIVSEVLDTRQPELDNEASAGGLSCLFKNNLVTIEEDKQLDISFVPTEEVHNEEEHLQAIDEVEGVNTEDNCCLQVEDEVDNGNEKEDLQRPQNMDPDENHLLQDGSGNEKEEKTTGSDDQEQLCVNTAEITDTDGKPIQHGDSGDEKQEIIESHDQERLCVNTAETIDTVVTDGKHIQQDDSADDAVKTSSAKEENFIACNEQEATQPQEADSHMYTKYDNDESSTTADNNETKDEVDIPNEDKEKFKMELTKQITNPSSQQTNIESDDGQSSQINRNKPVSLEEIRDSSEQNMNLNQDNNFEKHEVQEPCCSSGELENVSRKEFKDTHFGGSEKVVCREEKEVDESNDEDMLLGPLEEKGTELDCVEEKHNSTSTNKCEDIIEVGATESKDLTILFFAESICDKSLKTTLDFIQIDAKDLVMYFEESVLIEVQYTWQELNTEAHCVQYFEETRMCEAYATENDIFFHATRIDLEIHVAEEYQNPLINGIEIYTCSTQKEDLRDNFDPDRKLSTSEICREIDGGEKLCKLVYKLSMDLKIAVKGALSGKVVLEWEDNTNITSPEYSVMVLGDKFNSEVDSQARYDFTSSPTLEVWPSNQTSLIQHCWTTEHTVIEVHGLKAKHRYRIVVLATSRDSSSTCFRSDIITMTMPCRPKAPVIHVVTLKDRQFTISWRTPCTYGEANIVGYKLLISGSQHGDLLPHDAVQHTVNNLQHGAFQHVSLIAVTRHSVGDSPPSNVVTIACPHPPPPPDIVEHPSTNTNTISISWPPVPVSMTTDPNQLRLLSSYDVFVDDVLHGSCPTGDVTDIFLDSFTYTIPECNSGREYSIYVRGHVDPQMIDSSPPTHVCGCYGDMSNVLHIKCAGELSVPALAVDHMDEHKVVLSWEQLTEGTLHRIKGYALRVDNHIQGNILGRETQSATLTNLSLGNDVMVTLATIHNELPAENLPENHAQLHEPHDSGVESSSSLYIDNRIAARDMGPSTSLTLHMWGLVQNVSEVEVVKVTCCAVEVRWSLVAMDEKNEEGQHPLFVQPDGFRVKFWKSEELTETEFKTVETRDSTICVTDLTSSYRYAVLVEAFAEHPNYTTHSTKWNVSTSEKLRFDTKTPPYPPKNLRVVSSTLNSVCLSWDPLNTVEDLRFLFLDVYKVDCDKESVPSALMHFTINPHMTSYTIHSLDSKTQYLFKFRTSYFQIDSPNIHQHCCAIDSSIKAWTSGVHRPRDLHATNRTPFSLHVAWQPAVTYGDLNVLYYLVHRSAHGGSPTLTNGNSLRVPQGSALGPQCEIKGLEPGAVYKIIVEAVVKINDETDDNQPNEADEVASSIASSESDWMSQIAHDCMSKSITITTVAPPGKPLLVITGMSATQIHLYWNKPPALQLDPEDRRQAKEHDLCGRIRQVLGYTLEVNGRVVTRLPADKHNFTLKRCKPGMKYTCYLVAMTTAGSTARKQNKKHEGKVKKAIVTAVGTTEFDSDDEEIRRFQEARSDPLEVTIPRQDSPLVLNVHYNPTPVHVSSESSAGSEESEDGCIVLEWKSSTPLKGVSSYRVQWRGALDNHRRIEDHLSASSNSYELYPVKQRSLYTVWLQMFRNEGSTMYGPLHCQVPGRPDSPWIWCRSVTSYRILVEWNEPKTYGIDTIRAYQVNLNGRQLGKLLSPQTNKVAVHCQPNSVYRIALLALTADPHLWDAEPSNLLTVCTPGVTDKSLDPKQNIRLKPLWAENESLTVEWSDDNDLLTVDHYVIKWSSVRQPQSREETVPVEETSFTIEDCQAGTRHFIAVAAVDNRGKLLSKSSQLIMQTSAPLQAPRLRLISALPSSIIVEWDEPLPVGDAAVDSYEIKVNDVIRTTLDSIDLLFDWQNCFPCEEYRFHIRTLSTKEDCHSEWSELLPVVCPGSFQPVISRAPSSHVNSIHVTWDTPLLAGGATVKSYKVHYLASEDDDITLDAIINDPKTISRGLLHSTNLDDTWDNALPSISYWVDDIINDPKTVSHGPLDSTNLEDTWDYALPAVSYWVVLEVHLLPEGCYTVFSKPIKTRVAVSPDSPNISVTILGLKERQTLERFVSRLALLKDRIARKLQLLQNSVVVKGSKQKEIQITKNRATIHNLDIELKNCTKDMENYTGSLNAVLTWTLPRDDGDAIVTGYQVFLDGVEYGQPLDTSTLGITLKLPASSSDHVVYVKTLTSHPIGPSAPSNQITIHCKDCLPFVQFCYFGVHSETRGCYYRDSLDHEIKNKQIAHRGSFGKPLPSPVCYVTNVMKSCTQPLVQPSSKKSKAILFWTVWCHSSIKSMEMFLEFARSCQEDIDFITCCVQSGHSVSGHHQFLQDQLKSRDWLDQPNVQHLCGCYPVSQRSALRRSDGGGSKAGVCHLYGLVGVPTIVLCNRDGYMVWQGRICVQDYHTYHQCIIHALNESLNQTCTIADCDQCSVDHELDTTGLTSQLFTDPNERYNYRAAKHDPSLEVTGRLSNHSKDTYKKLPSHTDIAFDSRGSLLRVINSEPIAISTKDVHCSTLENTEYLHRRLHDTRPHTSSSKGKTPPSDQSLISLHTGVQFLNHARAKIANQERSSIFQNRFSSSMTSSLPSVGLTNDRESRKPRGVPMKTKKVRISVDEFSVV